jgi:enoyl-CoA hydratase
MAYEYTCITVTEPKPHVKVVTLNRPECLNAISIQEADDFLHALQELKNDYDCRVVILTGAGRGFCAGTDLKEMDEFSKRPNRLHNQWLLQKKMADIIELMRAIPQPIICAINGAAAGGGASFTMASDIRIAVPKSKIILAYINVGMTGADMGSSYFLPRLIGTSKATEIMMTGRPVLADEAERIGLVAKVVEPDQLMDTAMEYADVLLGKSELGLIMTKESISLGMDSGSLANQIHLENRNQFACTAMGTFAEGAANFKEQKSK